MDEELELKSEMERDSILRRIHGRHLCELTTLLVLLTLGIPIPLIDGHHQDIIMIDGDIKNPEINHPLLASTVSTAMLAFIILTVFAILLCYRALDLPTRWYGISAMMREMVWSVGLNGVITNFAKMYVGRPRPNFFEMCEWDGRGCTAGEMKAINAYESFISGHASWSMATFGLICIHFVENVLLQLRGYKLPLDRPDASPYGWVWNLFLPITTAIGSPAMLVALLPGFFAFFIGCSRIHDYEHFAGDVLAGAAIGLSSALLSFSMFQKQEHLDSSSPRKLDVELPKVEQN